jgi:antitoxin component HigA of HigAB toxin-antitoxin module
MSAPDFPIADEDTYTAAVHELGRLLGAGPIPGTDDSDMLSWLAERVEAYERERWPAVQRISNISYRESA